MNSVKDFSIPCLSSKRKLQERFSKKLKQDTGQELKKDTGQELQYPLPESVILSLNSDEIIKDSRFRDQISHSSLNIIPTEFKKDLCLVKTCEPSPPTAPNDARRITTCPDPKTGIIPPVKIKRTSKQDGTFDYRILRKLGLDPLQKYFFNGLPGDPIITALSCENKPKEAGTDNCSGSVVLEWMDDDMLQNPLSNDNTGTVMIIDSPEDLVPCAKVAKKMLPASLNGLSPRSVTTNRRYHNGFPLRRNGHISCKTFKSSNLSESTRSNVLTKQKSPAEKPKTECSLPKRTDTVDSKKDAHYKNHLISPSNGKSSPAITKTLTHEKTVSVNVCDNGRTLFPKIANGKVSSLQTRSGVKINSQPLTQQAASNVIKSVTIPVEQKIENALNGTSCSQNGMTDSDYQELLRKWHNSLNKGSTDKPLVHVENLYDKTIPPLSFNYISQSIYSTGVPVPDPTALFGCSCLTCGDSSKCCSYMAGQKFAYYKTGTLRVGFKTPIYECNQMCQCGPGCPNRVVQKGSQYSLCIFRTPDGRGWGVKTLNPIQKAKFVTEYVGELITSEEAERRGRQYDKYGTTYLFDLDFNDAADFTIDATQSGNVSHFLNHSCDPNLVVFPVWIDTLDSRLPRLALFARRDIQEGEELTFDYQMNHNMSLSYSQDRTPCLCGTKKCRGFLF